MYKETRYIKGEEAYYAARNEKLADENADLALGYTHGLSAGVDVSFSEKGIADFALQEVNEFRSVMLKYWKNVRVLGQCNEIGLHGDCATNSMSK